MLHAGQRHIAAAHHCLVVGPESDVRQLSALELVDGIAIRWSHRVMDASHHRNVVVGDGVDAQQMLRRRADDKALVCAM